MAAIKPSRLAYTILKGFEKSYRHFCNITRDSQYRFEQADWVGVQYASKERINSYDNMISELSLHLYYQLDKPEISTMLWQNTKAHYSKLLRHHPQAEQAETFFNSTFSRLFRHRGLNQQHLFIQSTAQAATPYQRQELCYIVDIESIISTTLQNLLNNYKFNIPWQDFNRDITLVREQLKPLFKHCHYDTIELIKTVFYRNKAAYLIGRLRGKRQRPFVLALLNNEHGEIYIDTLLTDWDDMSILFGFARAYFMVDEKCPAQLVSYLSELMPHKPIYELWSSLGIQKHSKTEFYRHYLKHLANSKDQFVLAEGIKGMVMIVFTLPSLGIVFKVIKDQFAPPKNITKAQVKAKYQLVKDHDRVGRLADTQQFSHFSFPRHRFSPQLIDEIVELAPSEITITDQHVIIKHLYTERKMIPLNMFLRSSNEQQIYNAMEQYGSAIKQLAAANIFPGDMLFKNFGMTRHGRVIFYDYDEIWYIEQCNFRELPVATTFAQQMASEPWYSVGEFDIFPQEFARFLLGRPIIKTYLLELHPELFDVEYWRDAQRNIGQGLYADVFPYRQQQRLTLKR